MDFKQLNQNIIGKQSLNKHFTLYLIFNNSTKNRMSDLKSKSLSSAKWNLLANAGQYVFTFFLSIVLSRMLTPAEFGLTSMLSVFISLSALLVNSGLSFALVRDKNATKDDFSTVFYFNIFVSIVLYLVLFFCAPFIASFYKQPELVGLTRWISLVFVLNSIGMIQNTILIINLNFKKQTIINISGLIISVVISIIMALKGYGVYSIVGQSVSQAFFVNLFLWVTADWKPVGFFKVESFKKLWKYSSSILFTGIFSSIMANVDNLIIGKIFKPHVLGLYTRAKSTRSIPEMIFTNMLNTTSFSILTKIHEQKEEYRRKHMMFYKLSVYFIFPFSVGFSLCSRYLVEILYGKKWLDSVEFLQIISFILIPNFLAALFTQTILSYGDSKSYMKVNVIKRLSFVISIPFGLFFGIRVYIFSILVLSFLGLFTDIFFTSRIIGTRMLSYYTESIKPFMFSVIVFALIYPIEKFLFIGVVPNLFFESIVAVASYALLLYLFSRDIFGHFLEFLKSFLKKI
jgi:O-antigen/teichoic acid export membrane protein